MELELVSKLINLFVTFYIVIYSFIFIISFLILFSIINAEILNANKQQAEKRINKKKKTEK